MPSQADSSSELVKLVIGWKLTRKFAPKFWGEGGKIAFKHNHDGDLIHISPLSMANHTVIVAQSGSGKSYFLGRIVEELLLKTKSNVLVFDPNGDFKKISDVVGPKSWKEKARYDLESGIGFCPDEYDQDDF
ncbi:MAG: ATP-binding protein [Thermoproteota archaeon]|nr:ATP-binding protein [Thermoproteota archaeon]